MSWIERIFGKNPRDLFLSFDPEGSEWRVVSWNLDLASPKDRQWLIEIHGASKHTIHWMKKESEDLFFFKDEKLLRKKRIASRNELKDLMNLSLHGALKFGLEGNQSFMLSPVSGATTMDFQSETRALQWLQTSLGTVMRALDNFSRKPELILTAAVFSGTVPDTGENVLRVLIFNLDIFYYLKADNSLQIVVFDDKNLGQGSAKAPTFQQQIKVTKPQFYDEIVKLVHRIAVVGEIQ